MAHRLIELPRPKGRRKGLVALLWAALAGTMIFLSYPAPSLYPLAWFALVPLLVVTRERPLRRVFLLGWVTGIVTNGGGFYWIVGLLRDFGHLPMVASIPIFLLMTVYQGLVFGLYALLAWWLVRRARVSLALASALAITVAEALLPFIFPWYLANSQAPFLTFIQVADIVGVLGLTFIIGAANGLLADMWHAGLKRRPFPRPSLVWVTGLLAVVLVYGGIRRIQVERQTEAAKTVDIGLVQANIGITEKWSREIREINFQSHLDLSLKLQNQGAKLIVWPETAYPYTLGRWVTDLSGERALHNHLNVPTLVGAVTYGPDPHGKIRFFNSAMLVEPPGRIVGRYDKNYLLVFGEYIPFLKTFPSLRKFVPNAGEFTAGTDVVTFPFEKSILGVMICYEDILPEFTRRLGRKEPNLIINLTNDAWFGDTSEPALHVALAVFRAVENRVWLLRSTNTGISCFIDATGRVVAKTGTYTKETLLQPTPLLEGGSIYQHLGDLFGPGAVLMTVMLIGFGVGLRRPRE